VSQPETEIRAETEKSSRNHGGNQDAGLQLDGILHGARMTEPVEQDIEFSSLPGFMP
jgi:hypothetical protein